MCTPQTKPEDIRLLQLLWPSPAVKNEQITLAAPLPTCMLTQWAQAVNSEVSVLVSDCRSCHLKAHVKKADVLARPFLRVGLKVRFGRAH